MSRKQKKDKLLLENLDRIVAGEKLKDESGLDKDTRAALELTRDMTSWPKSPSKEFKKDLRARIIHQLAEQRKQEVSKDSSPEFREVLRRHAWQFTIAAILFAIVAAIITVIVMWISK